MTNPCQPADLRRQLLSQLPPSLAWALEQIAQALPAELEHSVSGIPAFFHSFMDGFWTPFEEACAPDTEQLRQANQTVLALERELKQSLDQEQYPLLDKFCEAVNNRSTGELEHAFLVGYQSAIRLMLMGVLPLNTLIQEGPANES